MRPDRNGIRILFQNFRSKLEFQFSPQHMYVFIYRKIAKHRSPINLERLSSDSHSQRIGRQQVSDRIALLPEPNFVRASLGAPYLFVRIEVECHRSSNENKLIYLLNER